MTVKELIEILSGFDQDKIVHVAETEYWCGSVNYHMTVHQDDISEEKNKVIIYQYEGPA